MRPDIALVICARSSTDFADGRYSGDSTFAPHYAQLRRFAAKNFHTVENNREKFSVALLHITRAYEKHKALNLLFKCANLCLPEIHNFPTTRPESRSANY